MNIEQAIAYVELTRGNGDILLWEIVTPSLVVGRRFDIVEATVYPCRWNELTGEIMPYEGTVTFEEYVDGLDDLGREGLTQELRDATELYREVNHRLNRDLY